MSIQAALHHVTHYRYDHPVQLSPQVIRLRPAPHCRSKILSYSLTVEPARHFINWQQDPFANYQARLVFPDKTQEFKITVDLVTDMSVYNPFDFFLEPPAEMFPFQYDALLSQELAPYLAVEPASERLREYLGRIDQTQRRTIDFLIDVNRMVSQDVRYLVRMEPGVQTPDETLRLAAGSCRDSTWLLVNLLRHCALAARFASGYLIQLVPDVRALDGPSGTEVDFTDLHAWCEVYLPGAGWIGLDPTSGLLAGEGHIPLACTPQPSGAAPIEGGIELADVTFAHTMQVTRLHEAPRVTKPYTERQWAAVMQLGEAVDQQLRDHDVRLTMGGEPTFVANADRDADEWNTDALGPTKRAFATTLVHKLRAEYGQGGFLHSGQGQWYPGEHLPRWALSIYWRADGEPVWAHPELFVDEHQPTHYTSEVARDFTLALAQRLGLSGQHILPGYEDSWYYQWRGRRLPVHVDPLLSHIEDAMEAARLRRVFSQPLDTIVGYALPITVGENAAAGGPRWQTGPWFVRDERMVLTPGDAPMGLRLPVDSLPWVSQADDPSHLPQDPFDAPGDLPSPAAWVQQHAQASSTPISTTVDADHSTPANSVRVPERQQSAAWLSRTALCAEVRDPRRANGPQAETQGQAGGVLYVFMPPLNRLEDYLELLSAIEATANEQGVRLVLEGYPPPRDSRLTLLQVTPDPGVIEVNIHPVSNWAALVRNTEFLYNAAWECRLSAEKFLTDGRHTGTGGGNHFVMGGATPADSPFLRRPELLGSLLRYWHNHPSLSYLFSGMFVGPTSQAPRVDEARNDQLYELEIALQQISAYREQHGETMPPELVERSLRHILTDVTGNTHRSEFSIDKMVSPESATRPLGLLELRAFGMPPHARMSIAQQLLLRALVARFWNQPCQSPLSRWGTTLHDRFMLPTFIWMDFDDVITEMRAAGYGFDAAWFAPHLQFRFPLIGSIHANGMTLTLRTALEPWHLMGQEDRVGVTARYVDSSLERIEVHVTGFNASRYAITCNGRSLAMQPTGTEGVYVAGVRYKAWNPPSSLHPSIGVHAPLTFDIVDTWMHRSIAGCQYHVSHPGGLHYDSVPVNANEAESRRLSRFVAMGHTPGLLPDVPPSGMVAANREFPFTLDLRHPPDGA